MNTSGDAAEQVVRLSIEGAEFAVRIAGKGAKEIGVFLIAALQGAKRTKGKTRLASLLKSGKELRVFSLSESDLKKFATEAKKYGVLYAALKGIKKSEDGMVDIMCRAEDGSKINRIFERFSIGAIDTAAIYNDVLRSVEEREEQSRDMPETPPDVKAEQEALQPNAEKSQNENPTTESLRPKKISENPTTARQAKSLQSESSSESSSRYEAATSFDDTRDKPSVRKQLAEIRAEQSSHQTGRSVRESSQNHGKSTKPQKHTKKGR